MCLKCAFELTLSLDSDKFYKLSNRECRGYEYLEKDEYIDHSPASKGITVIYRDSQYKKKVRLLVNSNLILGGEQNNVPKLIHKTEKRINEYFSFKYRLDDFNLTGMILSADMDVGDRTKAGNYIKVLQRVGRVKGFSPSSNNTFDNNIGISMDGNSNGIEFLLYDLEEVIREQMQESEFKRKQLKSIAKETSGIIRAEVRLVKLKAIRDYTDEADASALLAKLFKAREKVFLDTFLRIIPFGDFHKKDKAVEIISREVTDPALRRRMLYLLELIPKKKSLLLAQKTLNSRRIDEIMDEFAAIDLSPVTLSKRHDVKKLDNLYKYLGNLKGD